MYVGSLLHAQRTKPLSCTSIGTSTRSYTTKRRNPSSFASILPKHLQPKEEEEDFDDPDDDFDFSEFRRKIDLDGSDDEDFDIPNQSANAPKKGVIPQITQPKKQLIIKRTSQENQGLSDVDGEGYGDLLRRPKVKVNPPEEKPKRAKAKKDDVEVVEEKPKTKRTTKTKKAEAESNVQAEVESNAQTESSQSVEAQPETDAKPARKPRKSKKQSNASENAETNAPDDAKTNPSEDATEIKPKRRTKKAKESPESTSTPSDAPALKELEGLKEGVAPDDVMFPDVEVFDVEPKPKKDKKALKKKWGKKRLEDSKDEESPDATQDATQDAVDDVSAIREIEGENEDERRMSKRYFGRHRIGLVTIPIPLKKKIAQLFHGVSRHQIRQEADALSKVFRMRTTTEFMKPGTRLEDRVTPTDPIDYSMPRSLAYVAHRMTGVYACTKRLFHEISEQQPSFAPTTMLDFGSGPGTTIWSARDTFPSIKDVTAVEPSEGMITCAKTLLGDKISGVNWKNYLLVTPESSKSDLVVGSYVLSEFNTPKERKEQLKNLWEATAPGGIIAIVEPGTPMGFQIIKDLRTSLDEIHGQYRPKIMGPCPHRYACPMANSKSWCHFSQKVQRHDVLKTAKEATLDWEDEKFSYLLIKKEYATPNTERPQTWSRIVSVPLKRGGHVSFAQCSPKGLIENVTIARSIGKDQYKAARKVHWGDTYLQWKPGKEKTWLKTGVENHSWTSKPAKKIPKEKGPETEQQQLERVEKGDIREGDIERSRRVADAFVSDEKKPKNKKQEKKTDRKPATRGPRSVDPSASNSFGSPQGPMSFRPANSRMQWGSKLNLIDPKFKELLKQSEPPPPPAHPGFSPPGKKTVSKAFSAETSLSGRFLKPSKASGRYVAREMAPPIKEMRERDPFSSATATRIMREKLAEMPMQPPRDVREMPIYKNFVPPQLQKSGKKR